MPVLIKILQLSELCHSGLSFLLPRKLFFFSTTHVEFAHTFEQPQINIKLYSQAKQNKKKKAELQFGLN